MKKVFLIILLYLAFKAKSQITGNLIVGDSLFQVMEKNYDKSFKAYYINGKIFAELMFGEWFFYSHKINRYARKKEVLFSPERLASKSKM